MREVKKLCEPLGFTLVGQSGGDRLKMRHAGGQVYFAALTPSCHRGQRDMLADLRRISQRDRAA